MNPPASSEDLHPPIVMSSKLDLRYPPDGPTRQLTVSLAALTSFRFPVSLVKEIWRARPVSVVFASIPGSGELLFMSLIKTIYRKRIKTCVFDLVMREPGSIREGLFAWMKRKLLRSIDLFIFIHRDTSGYERAYGISREKCVYVPFKANNFDLVQSLVSIDGDYALALGTSQRDYRLLVDAVDDQPIRLKIVAPQANVSTHGARLGSDSLPPNIDRIDRSVDRIEWNTLIAQSRLVVIPILPGVLQPAGISVCLEAMMLGKPVIITRGTSTEGILDDNLALLVPPGDVDALRRAITRLWNDSELRSALSENGKRYALSLGNHERLLTDLRAVIQREYALSESSRQRHR